MLAAVFAFLRRLIGRDALAPEPTPPPPAARSFIDDIDPKAIELGGLVIQHAARRLDWIHGKPLSELPPALPAEIEAWLAAKDRNGLLAVCGCSPWELGPHVLLPAGKRGPCEARVGPVRRIAPPSPKAGIMRGEEADGRQGQSGKGGPGGITPHEAFMAELRASMEPAGPRMR